MTIEECNLYIKNYLKNDKTKNAIMLTAPWGTGKSYYIKNNLIKFLEENKLSYVMVSAYGISSIADLNKELFLEIKFQKRNKQRKWLEICGKTIATGAVGIGKTLLKNVAKIDIDFNLSEPNYKKLYDLINLKEKLIIFEDIERSSINIIEFLGYVNSLVEQDGVKVLLVANEQEFLKEENSESQQSIQGKTEKEKTYTLQSKEYLRQKEKTISDTIIFGSDKKESLKNIIGLFFEKNLSEILTDDKNIEDITNMMEKIESDNLRAVMFACQKTSNIIKEFCNGLDENFIKFLLCGIIAYSCRMKKGDDVNWKNNESSPANLGTATFPLYRVCYDYIKTQHLNKKQLEDAQKSYLNQKAAENAQNEFSRCFKVVRFFYNNTETEVSTAVSEIKNQLSKNSGIAITEYGMLANYLIAVKDYISNPAEVEDCKELMLKNVQGIKGSSALENDIMYHNGIELETEKQKEELATFKKDLLKAINSKNEETISMSNFAENIGDFISNVYSRKDEIIASGSFIGKINIEKFIEVLKKCDSQTIGEIRGLFRSIYAATNIGEFMFEDKTNLELLKAKLNELENVFDGYDKIQKKQIAWFVNNLEEILQKFSN